MVDDLSQGEIVILRNTIRQLTEENGKLNRQLSGLEEKNIQLKSHIQTLEKDVQTSSDNCLFWYNQWRNLDKNIYILTDKAKRLFSRSKNSAPVSKS